MNRATAVLLVLAGLLAVAVFASRPAPKVTAASAKSTALKQCPGATVGEPTLAYLVTVRTKQGTQKVAVDTATGRATVLQSPVRAVRYGSVIRLRPGAYRRYAKLHAAVWPTVLAALKRANVRNYSIYEKDGYLFSYLEYTGGNYKADMAKMAADPATQRWWSVCMPLQQPLKTRKPGEWWASMKELFHMD